MPASRPRSSLRRLPLLLALGATGCLFGDCTDPLSQSARRGDAQVLLRVSYDTTYAAPLPAVVYRDSQVTVRIVADTLRFYPRGQYYRRKVQYGVRTGDGAEVFVPTVPDWVNRTLYEVDMGWDRYVVLDSFEIAPGVPPGSARWDSFGERDTVLVWVRPHVHRDTTQAAREQVPAYLGRWAPAGR